eukprot:991243_1
MSGFSKRLNQLNSSELRKIANSNLCRIFDEDRGGEKWEDDEDLFVRELHRSGVSRKDIAAAVNRSTSSINNRVIAHMNTNYVPRANGDPRARTIYDPPMTWRAESCLLKLPGYQGSSKQLREIA